MSSSLRFRSSAHAEHAADVARTAQGEKPSATAEPVAASSLGSASRRSTSSERTSSLRQNRQSTQTYVSSSSKRNDRHGDIGADGRPGNGAAESHGGAAVERRRLSHSHQHDWSDDEGEALEGQFASPMNNRGGTALRSHRDPRQQQLPQLWESAAAHGVRAHQEETAGLGERDDERFARSSADKALNGCTVSLQSFSPADSETLPVGRTDNSARLRAALGAQSALEDRASGQCDMDARQPAMFAGMHPSATSSSSTLPPKGAARTLLPPHPTWRKVLYERQPFEDNYVDPDQFLEELRENENVRGYEYANVVSSTFAIVQQIAIVVLFVCAFGFVYSDALGQWTLTIVNGAILLMSWVMYVRIRIHTRKQADDSDLLLFGGMVGSPASRRTGGGGATSTATASTAARVPESAHTENLQRSPANNVALGSPAETSFPPNARGLASSPSNTTSPLLSAAGRHGSSVHASAFAGTSPGLMASAPPAVAGVGEDVGTSSPRPPPLSAQAPLPEAVAEGGPLAVPLTFGYVADFGRKVISLGSFIVLVTPILSSLTAAYSNDTIIALSILTMALHILTADYSYLNGYKEQYAPNLSVNSAIFGVILMASRIHSPLESGSLIMFGAFCFSLAPVARHAVKLYSNTANIALTVVLFFVNTCCLMSVPVLCITYVTSSVVIAFVVPWCFVSLHSSVKYQISGPWDEAKPKNSAAAAEWANAGLLQ